MTVKILLLKSGEDVIADVSEMVAGEEDSERVIGYFLRKPCIVKLLKKPSKNDTGEEKAQTSISMFPWMPLAKEERIPLATDWVVTMVTPIDKLQEMYNEDVLKNEPETDQVDNIDDPADVGLTD